MKRYCKSGLVVLITGAIVLPVSASINIAKKPLFLESAMPPNIMFTLDDSGSMSRSFLPESIGDGANNCVSPSYQNITSYYSNAGFYRTENNVTKAIDSYGVGLCKAQNFNQLYYDPRITYPLRINYDKTNKPAGDISICKSVIYEEQTCTATGQYSGTVADTQIGLDSSAVSTVATECANSSANDTNRCTRTCNNPELSSSWSGRNSCRDISYNCYSLPTVSECPECQSVALTSANLSLMYLKRPSSSLVLSDPVCHKARYRYCKDRKSVV